MEFLNKIDNEKESIILKIAVDGDDILEFSKDSFMKRINNEDKICELFDLNFRDDSGDFYNVCESINVPVKLDKISLLLRLKICHYDEKINLLSMGNFLPFDAILYFYSAYDEGSFDYVKKYCDFSLDHFFQNNPIRILLRCNYDIPFLPDMNEKIIKDEEVLEFAESKNLYFFRISTFEQYESGIKELLTFIIEQSLQKKHKYKFK